MILNFKEKSREIIAYNDCRGDVSFKILLNIDLFRIFSVNIQDRVLSRRNIIIRDFTNIYLFRCLLPTILASIWKTAVKILSEDKFLDIQTLDRKSLKKSKTVFSTGAWCAISLMHVRINRYNSYTCQFCKQMSNWSLFFAFE